MFRITDHKGFSIRFENGWAISVQWGPGNYSDHHQDRDYNAPRLSREPWDSTTAEVAVIHRTGPWFNAETMKVTKGGEHVDGWCSPARVAEIIAIVVALPDNPVVPEETEGDES